MMIWNFPCCSKPSDRSAWWIAAGILVGSSMGVRLAGAAELLNLGDLPGGPVLSQAWGISSDGSAVVGFSKGLSLYNEAFLWTRDTGMVGLGSLPGGLVQSQGFGVSADGSRVVGQSHVEAGAEAFLWTQLDGMVGLGDFSAVPPSSIAYAISADGAAVVGGAHDHTKAFRWTEAAGMVYLGDLPGGADRSEAFAVSADGSVVVGESRNATGTEAFIWTEAEGMIGLGTLPNPWNRSQSSAAGISADGRTVTGSSVGPTTWEPFLWTEEDGMVGLGDLAGNSPASRVTQALAISADGRTVVGTGETPSGRKAFIWDPFHGMRTLEAALTGLGVDLSGWQLSWATGVSADGLAIAGYGAYNGNTTAFLATLDSVPAYSCVGFQPPADGNLVVRKPSRVVPLRMSLLDSEGMLVLGLTPPVLQIWYSSGGSNLEYLDELDYAGNGDEGNKFVFDGAEWAFNLSTRNLASGTYELTGVSGDESEYTIEPACRVKVTIK